MIQKNPYISILKLKGSLVDMSVVAINCAILEMWDYRAFLVILAGIMIHSGCDIINDIFDREIDKICKPEGAIASGRISINNAYLYMLTLFSLALLISLQLSVIFCLCLLAGIIIGGVLYSHPFFRLKDIPGIAMLNMAVCFALESIGIWSVYSPLNVDSLKVAAYIFILIFCLTFMKDFKDVRGDINSLPLMIGIKNAAMICILLTAVPLIPLIYIVLDKSELYISVIIYIVLAISCTLILIDNPVSRGKILKNRMVMTLTIPNFAILALEVISLL
ncbi:UbiA family prenyltransferase [Methanolobus psychrotolerans]|uniref:UbiA family prenyltransferase n=1 Tax=Methanolobus psychrotolerans TaxID=1874706 RepID=UPI001F5CE7FB|nr:UbiA family prenyltransferase [Methanolobus psychrotolerans]